MAQARFIEIANREDADAGAPDRAAWPEARSWEPPCWPADEMSIPRTRIGLGAMPRPGRLRFPLMSMNLKIARH